MSGWQKDGTFELTSTKASYWQSGRVPSSSTWAELFDAHLAPRGWERLPSRGTSHIVIQHPEYSEDPSTGQHSTGFLFECVATLPPHDPPLEPVSWYLERNRYIDRSGGVHNP